MFFTAYGVGANDVANAMGTSVGSKVLTISQAVLIAAIFEFLGAFFAGGGLPNNEKGVIDPELFVGQQEILSTHDFIIICSWCLAFSSEYKRLACIYNTHYRWGNCRFWYIYVRFR